MEIDEWAGLDLDDSDLRPSLLRPSSSLLPSKRPPPADHQGQEPKPTVSVSPSLPSLRPCTQIPSTHPSAAQQSCSRRRIPGPAGSVQAVMHREALRAEICVPGSGCEEADDDDDEDFKLNPWLCALDFLGWDARAPLPYSIRTSQAMERIPLVVGVIKSCRPNGLGDLIVTMKDPTGTIGASIHQKVLAKNEFASDISVDSVIVLQEVVAFSPTHSLRYLNVTIKNVVKVRMLIPTFTPVRPKIIYLKRPPGIGVETRLRFAAAPIIRQQTDEIINVITKRVETDTGTAIGRASEGSLRCGNAKAPVVEEPDHETNRSSNMPTCRAPLPEWTDEQLEELFGGGDDFIIQHLK
ncbi:hypothetical protein ACLOJK_000576 [Asimina triloba]